MNLRPLLGAVLLFVLSLLCASRSSAFFPASPQNPWDVDPPFPSSETQNLHATDRENAGLRGPVSVNIEEKLSGDGSKDVTTTRYSPDGKLLMPKTSFTSVPEPGGHVDVRYEQGVKSTIQTFDSKTQMPSSFSYDKGHSPWDLAALGAGVPKGANVTTLYDENNQATELQIRGADGTVIYKFVRAYNANGRVTEEKMILENPTAYFLDNLSEEQRAKLGGPEEFKRVVTIESAMLRGKAQVGAFYTFDEQNRLVKIVERDQMWEKTTTIAYNDQGDAVEKQATFADNAAFPAGVLLGVDATGTAVQIDPHAKPNPPAWVPKGYSIRYVYQYDSFGNWVQRIRTVSMDSEPEPGPNPSVRNRTLSYYQPITDK
jgi:hypothetical protein